LEYDRDIVCVFLFYSNNNRMLLRRDSDWREITMKAVAHFPIEGIVPLPRERRRGEVRVSVKNVWAQGGRERLKGG